MKSAAEGLNSEVVDLAKQVRRHQKLYDKGTPEISDEAFDALIAKLRKLDPKNPVLDELGSAQTGRRLNHVHPMLSLEKAKDAKAVLAWAKKLDTVLIVAPKYDGLALSLTYKQGKLISAVTRGDGTSGDDVTHNVQHMRSVPKRLPDPYPPIVTVRGEALFPRDADAEVLGSFVNARNGAAGTLLRKTPEPKALAVLDFLVYDVLIPDSAVNRLSKALELATGWGFDVGPIVGAEAVTLAAALERAVEEWGDLFRYECDGAVVKVDRFSFREKLGVTSHHPRWAIALKFATEKSTTKLIDVSWQVSRSGIITPVAEVEPVKLSGAMVSRATLHNTDQIRRLGFDLIGAKVEMSRRGGVIPHVERVVKPGKTLLFPTKCPACGELVYRSDGALFCSEPQACCGVRLDLMHHWCSTIDMLGWGTEVLAKLWDKGVRSRKDIYECDDVLDVLGKTLGRKLAKERDAKSTMEPATFLAALGIPGVGKTQAQKLLAQLGDVERILNLCDTDHDSLREMLTPAMFKNLTDGVLTQRREIEELLGGGLVKLKQPEPKIEGPLSGLVIVFTGRLADMEREEARDLVRSLGAEAPDSITMKTTHLVVGSLARDEQLSKREKAEKYRAKGANIQVIDEEAFSLMIANASVFDD